MTAASQTTVKPLPGKIEDSRKTMFMSTAIGDATIKKDGKSYQLALLCAGWGAGPPLIHCEETHKWYSITWDEIVDLAVSAGILEPFPPTEGLSK